MLWAQIQKLLSQEIRFDLKDSRRSRGRKRARCVGEKSETSGAAFASAANDMHKTDRNGSS